MPYPTPYSRLYSYTAFQQAQGDTVFPGVDMDADLDAVANTTSTLTTFIENVMRADGKLANGIVTKEALSADVQMGLPVPTPWLTATNYAVGATVTQGLALYYCLVPHLSSVFNTDVASGYWQMVVSFATMGLLPANTVGASQLVAGAVTAPAIAANAVTTSAIADGAVTASKLSSAALVPIGASFDFDGIDPPTGYLLKYGQAVSRTTYAALLAVLTKTFTAVVTAGSPVLTSVNVDLTAYGPNMFKGAVLEGFGLSGGVTIVSYTSNTVTVSANALSSDVLPTTYRAFPSGNGDGSTTFNIPDDRGRTSAGRDDMGGTAAGRLTAATFLGSMGAAGGAETHALTVAELASHTHATSEAPHTHSTTESPHTHGLNNGVNYYAAGAAAGAAQTAGVSQQTGSATTGLTINAATTGLSIVANGSGAAHTNMPPTIVRNRIIYAGV